jgi:hypothetical protein
MGIGGYFISNYCWILYYKLLLNESKMILNNMKYNLK